MKTIIFIHGGESFSDHNEYLHWITTTSVEWNLEPFVVKSEKKKWKIEIAKNLTHIGDTIYMPNFPNSQNAKYSEWRLFFETWIHQILSSSEIVLIGNSLGGCFLLKYLGENPSLSFVEKIKNIHLIASCMSAGDFSLPENYDFLQKLGNRVHIWHSEDDDVVPFSIGQRLSEILPEAEAHFFDSKKGYGHFHGIESFPELESFLKK